MNIEAQKLKNRLESFARTCREHGLVATHQRMEIYRVLARTEEHPSAETVYKRVRQRIPAISLDTVYRTLRLLESKGIIARVGAAADRAQFDANTDRHHHFVCSKCGLIRDFYSDALNAYAAPPDVATLGTVASVHIELRGVCARCAARRPKHFAGGSETRAGSNRREP